MKFSLLLAMVAAAAVGQSTTSLYTTDLNGHRVQDATLTSDNGQKTVHSQSINGRVVPIEQVEEKVLRSDATGKLTETIVRKYSPDGSLASTERTVTEQQILPGGGSTVHSTVYRADTNGNMEPGERKTIETRVTGTRTTTETVIERPTINGSFETIEKRSLAKDAAPAGTTASETVYRKDTNGGFAEALRQVTSETKDGAAITKNMASYEPGVTGRMELNSQTVSKSVKNPDGTETVEVNLYSRAAEGRAQENGAPQQIKEQQIITRRKQADGSTVETIDVRRPTIADPGRLGAAAQLSETVCTGKCDQP